MNTRKLGRACRAKDCETSIFDKNISGLCRKHYKDVHRKFMEITLRNRRNVHGEERIWIER